MTNAQRKSLYLFLTSLLGILLFLMLHRSLFVIYDILGGFMPGNPIFNIDPVILYTVDFVSMVTVIFLGGWYGVWLGLDWYKIIYEERQSREWFHAFLPHHWRGYHSRKHSTTQTEPEKKRILVKSFSATSAPRIESFSSFKTTPVEKAWSFDDVVSPSVGSSTTKPKRKAVSSTSRRKRVVNKKTA